MSLKQKLSKVLERLSDVFERAIHTEFPQPVIQKEMEAEGWKFEVHYASPPMPYGGGCACITSVTAPNGDPAWNNGATEAQRQHFVKTVAEKRIAHGMKP